MIPKIRPKFLPLFAILYLLSSLSLLIGCAHVKVDPIEVKPIHIVADINVRVERQLDDFFAFEKTTTAPATATAPAVTQ
jgi:hypothetical protein